MPPILTSSEKMICKYDSFLCNASSFIEFSNVDVCSALHQPPAHTVIADKDEFLTLFLNLISDEQGRKQREGSTEGMERQWLSKRTVGGSERERGRERERERDRCPKLLCDLTITEFAVSWLEKTLDSMATCYLKKWAGLARLADPARLFLPQANGGFNLLLPSALYQKL